MSEAPRFPLYIPSKGRSEFMMTSRALTQMGVRHSIVVEPQEVDAYREAVNRLQLLTDVVELDMAYKESYELCDGHGLSKSTGSGPARNFIWDHSIAAGHAWHWIMDDNIRDFYRLNRNRKYRVHSPVFFSVLEEFVLRYQNIAMAGPNYEMFVPRKWTFPPFVTNTRIYSCNLIRNDLPFRWRGRYNEDTILSLDLLKAGWATVLFNAFLQDKQGTQTMKGGNTDEIYLGEREEGQLYAKGGTDEKSRMLALVHPDVARVVWRYGRVHHLVDYSPFKRTRLIRRPDWQPAAQVNEFGMKLQPLQEAK